MNIFEHRERLLYGSVLEKVGEDPIYYKRSCDENEDWVKEFQKSRLRAVMRCRDSEQDSELVRSFGKTFEYQQKSCKRKYDTVFDSVAFDERGYVELAGTSRLLRKYSYVVDLGDRLDIFLAFLSGDSLDSVRSGIDKVCQETGTPYRLLSRAWLTQETELYKYARVEDLFKISSKMEAVCNRIVRRGYGIGGTREFRNVNIYKLSMKDILQLVIQSQMLMDMHYILSECIRQYDSFKSVNGDTLLMSKGICFLLFSSNNDWKDFSFDVNLRSDLKLRIKAKCFERGDYLSQLTGDGLQCVELLG